MKRREFITLVGGAAVSVAACGARAAAGDGLAAPHPFAHLVRAFHEGLSDAGYVESRNVVIHYRWARG
jgi:putative ABC transport system substrate-binding protein